METRFVQSQLTGEWILVHPGDRDYEWGYTREQLQQLRDQLNQALDLKVLH
jgi:hypothetical protein